MRTHQYSQELFASSGEPSPLFAQAKAFAAELGLDRISLSMSEALLLRLFVQSFGCRKFVEIGTLTGYSALWIAAGMPAGGELFTLEKNPAHANCARQVFDGVKDVKITLLEGDARETLPKLGAQGPFDGIFIDGNKAAYMDYLLWAEINLKPGSLILADNVFLSGAVWGENPQERFSAKQIRIMQEFNQRLADPSRYESALIPTPEGLFVAKLLG